MDITVKNENIKLNGTIEIPADKSISHRAALFSILTKGKSIIKNYSLGQDPLTTLQIIADLGAEITQNLSTIEITTTGKLIQPTKSLNCRNSGTTARLIAGILARQNFNSQLLGDTSLSSRPMKRIIEPLTLMGGKIESIGGKLPLLIKGSKLNAITYTSKISSAQVKSCVLLAGLGAEGTTTFVEPYQSRNHTEILLNTMGANIQYNKNKVSISKSNLFPIKVTIPGDISSAAYFIVATLIIPNSHVILKNIGINKTRTGIIDIIKRMGGYIKLLDKRNVEGEEIGDIEIKYSNLKACIIEKDDIPRLIDEIPIIALLATQADGDTIISNAEDLRNKESDRITTIATQLNKLGANIVEKEDGMIIHGKTQLVGNAELKTFCDHRLAMTFYIAALICKKEIIIKDFDWVNISFPEFQMLFNKIMK